MTTPKEEKYKVWSKQQGEPQFVVGGDEMPKGGEQDYSDDIHGLLKAKKAAIELASAKNLTADDKIGGDGKGETLATSIVTKAMDATAAMNKNLQDETDKLRLMGVQLQNEKFATQSALLDEKIGRINDQKDRAAAAAQVASAAGAPPSMFDAYRIVQQEVDTIVATKFPKTLAHSGEDSRVQIELNRLQHAHELAIEELKGEREQANNQFQVTMLELKDRMERQWAEYKDNKATREDALGGLQDILGSLAAGVKVGGGGGGEAGIQAEVAGFKCQNCGSEVVVPDGASEVVCPDEKCGYQYKIHRK